MRTTGGESSDLSQGIFEEQQRVVGLAGNAGSADTTSLQRRFFPVDSFLDTAGPVLFAFEESMFDRVQFDLF